MKITLATLGLAATLFLVWRFVRPMNIFVVAEAFERPIPTADVPFPLRTLSARECAVCHREFFREWATTMHSRAWTDPYFQVDWRFDRSQQICKNCHTPLDRQQEHAVLGFRDRAKWKPILAANPSFDPELQHEGVTCAACHLQDGEILGPWGNESAPHPVRKLDDPNQVCVRCHVVGGDRWDTFYRLPPCGTVAEIRATRESGSAPTPVGRSGRSGEVSLPGESLDCVRCHMPAVERPVVAGGEVKRVRRHLWRGGHDPKTVKGALDVRLEERSSTGDRRAFTLTLTNVGAAHYLPTGTPDRHLTVEFRLLDREGEVLEEDRHTLRRTILWRPFIVDLWDTRLPQGEPRAYTFEFSRRRSSQATVVEALVRYHLLDEKRRRRIGYENTEPIAYDLYRTTVALREPEEE